MDQEYRDKRNRIRAHQPRSVGSWPDGWGEETTDDGLSRAPARPRPLLAAGLVEDCPVPHRHRAAAGLCAARRSRRVLHSAGREGGKRFAYDDRGPRPRRGLLERYRQTTPRDPPPPRG